MALDLSLPFNWSSVSRSVFTSAPSSFTARTFTPFTSMALPARSSPCEVAILVFMRATSFSSAFMLSSVAASFASTSCGCALSVLATRARRSASCCACAIATVPAIASTRRMPAATPPSETMRKSPMSPVRATWVPPQSSREEPMSSTRTSSPYFSPKSIIAPSFCAASIGMTRAVVGSLRRTSALTIFSTRRISSADIGAGWLKSKRVLSSSTSEPFCST